ncbi:MAG TPA: GDSL-type esterase/lipase family protein [Verrucomicrobium sp.]|nr:GDSL-type esterase/lipase family protein [Verrucomicrobium sp.]
MSRIALRSLLHPWVSALALLCLAAPSVMAQRSSAVGHSPGDEGELPDAKRILFLGDSITAAGQYIELIETVVLAKSDKRYEFINLGLSSETVSGLSEPGHADGKFPRPNLHERLVRALEMTKPDLMVACYGMNDGIYFPYKDDRFEKFVKGTQTMRDRAWDKKIPVIHLTPPVFDPLPIKDKVLPPGLSSYPQPFVRYNTVLDRYTLWMMGKSKRTGWRVVDVHGVMNTYLEEKRKTDPEFFLAKDGIHPNAEGHWVMAKPLLAWWGLKPDYQVEDFIAPDGKLHALYQLVSERQRVMKAAWLSAVGHKRPGVTPGLPLAEAEQKAAEITAKINALLAGGKPVLAAESAAPTPAPVLASTTVPAPAPEPPTPAPAPTPAPSAEAAAVPAAPAMPAVVMASAAPIPNEPAAPEVRPAIPVSALAKVETVPVTAPAPPPLPGKEAAVAVAATVTSQQGPALYPGKRSKWQGYDRYDFEVGGPTVTVVAPAKAAKGKPWVWHGEFFGHKPDPDVALLGKGYHIVYMRLPDMLGSPPAVKHWNACYATLTKEHGFSKKPALVGLSRGGLYCYDWAIANPDKVSCIYGDAPVCDFKSWPGGKGKGKGDAKNWQLVMQLWGFKDEAEALAYKGNPVDSLAPLAKRKVPLLHVFGDADDVVPWEENTGLIAERYRKLGGPIELIAKAGVGHHPHGLQDSTPIVEFILKNTK